MAILSCKLISKLIVTLSLGQGGTLGGRIALLINKSLFENFEFGHCKVLMVTGTNGKSTTAGMLSNVLSVAGFKVAYNKSGANLLSGIANTLCFFSNLSGKIEYDYLILEVDEAALHHATKHIRTELIAVTNLFRDQLDRFGELDTTAKLIEKGIENASKLNPDLSIVLNADDPKVASLKTSNKKIFFGLDETSSNHKNGKEDATSWLSDPIELSNNKNIDSKPELDFSAMNLRTDELSTNFEVKSEHFKVKRQNFFLPFIGKFNFYNALCAIAIARTVTSATVVQIQKGFQSYSTIFGRAEKVVIDDKNAWIYLIKNPAGTTEVLKTLTELPKARFLIALNDNFADGRDVSWIWDARFDLLSTHQKDIFVSGKRASDMALRLKYANLDEVEVFIEENIEKAVFAATQKLDDDETLYILPTYTVLLEMQRKKLCKNQPL